MKDSYEKQERYYQLGETYFWLASHYDTVMALSKKYLDRQKEVRGQLNILDAGCSPGNLVSRLLSFGEVIGADASVHALEFCKSQHAIPVKQIDGKELPFEDESFDFVFALEVVEHIEDDLYALQEIYRILKPNGYFILTVPAFMFLWGYHDELYEHYRRYNKSNLSQLARKANFKISKIRYFKILFFFPLLFLRLFKRTANKKQDDFYMVSKPVNSFFRTLINCEIPIVDLLPLPFGSSLVAVLKKK